MNCSVSVGLLFLFSDKKTDVPFLQKCTKMTKILAK
jgi:hypothetical protein